MKKYTLLLSALGLGMFLAFGGYAQASEHDHMVADAWIETMATTASESAAHDVPMQWQRGGWGDNSPTFTEGVKGVDSDHAMQVTISEYASGDAKWYRESVPVTPGETYEFSDSYQATVPSELVVEFQTKDGEHSYMYIDTLPESDIWQHVSKTFTVPDGATAATMFHLIYSVGTLTTDKYSLARVSDAMPVAPPVVQTSTQSTDEGSHEPVGAPSAAEPAQEPATPDGKPVLPTSSTGTGLVSLNFDDGWISDYTTALPKLQEKGFVATYYITTHHLDNPGYMSKQNVLDIQAAGFEIGAHSLTHSSLPSLSQAEMRNEIAGSKAELEAMGVNSVQTFAYPYGEYNASVMQAVRDAGFIAARSTDFGFNTSSTDPYNLHIQSVEVNTSVEQMKAWIDEAVTNNTWLILLFHQIDNEGGQYSYTPENFQQVLDYISQRQVRTVTMTQGLAQVK